MFHLLDQLRLWIEGLVLWLGYPGIALAMMLENLLPFLPAEAVMPLAGVLVARGQLSMGGVVGAATLGSLLGALGLYALARWANEPLLRRFLRRHGRLVRLGEGELDRALATFDRYGPRVVFWGRLVPMGRSLSVIPAGIHGLPWARFSLYVTLGSLLWATGVSLGGLIVGRYGGMVAELLRRALAAT